MKQKDLLFILIPVFILSVLWVIFTIHHSLVSTTIKDPLTVQIIPIEGSFDTKTIDELKNRSKINPAYEQEVTPSPTLEITPTEEPTPSPEVEVSLTPEPSP